jgi:hypothetical protein
MTLSSKLFERRRFGGAIEVEEGISARRGKDASVSPHGVWVHG